MIQLRSDCLVFETTAGELIPCSAEAVTIELIGEATSLLDPELVQQASAAVLHYFLHEQDRTHVTVEEFSRALEAVLRTLGLDVQRVPESGSVRSKESEADLRQLACESGAGFELGFFPRLRDELRRQLHGPQQTVRFTGLRGCVKQLTGARRWNGRCQELHDRIVDYLRGTWSTQPEAVERALVVH